MRLNRREERLLLTDLIFRLKYYLEATPDEPQRDKIEVEILEMKERLNEIKEYNLQDLRGFKSDNFSVKIFKNNQ